jgi:quinol monooxygenase YgiN
MVVSITTVGPVGTGGALAWLTVLGASGRSCEAGAAGVVVLWVAAAGEEVEVEAWANAECDHPAEPSTVDKTIRRSIFKTSFSNKQAISAAHRRQRRTDRAAVRKRIRCGRNPWRIRASYAAGGKSMAKFALYGELKAKPGKEAEVEAFLKQGAAMARNERGTLAWFAIKEDDGVYGIFDTFDDEAGRNAHLNGEIAKALMAKASDLFSEPPKIHKIDILAEK